MTGQLDEGDSDGREPGCDVELILGRLVTEDVHERDLQ